ncbi:MAG TPA: prolipoprotein diacylglyceryl transferase [Dictyoglomaceae bacterium]|nr:prolipoprotein diacylglyceryl transferase [Dictyoglomaceae bacterium]HOL39561.1 prolipoprotein diacylglyceryl transferase [Dictyoglomaceae bacterium]HOP94646.1 prolipoprotein diacylglyceryl transferase [Dictyoglomaceae bacterium]HPP16426.1 prolipoprotein diacylglyceryl transferase [Dictyoglomaceae bacterium]HPU43319.1 prolipoprotein diacylglyceryl transferase [Dictyoglomaceae bacterium]
MYPKLLTIPQFQLFKYKIGPIVIYSWGTFVALGFLVGILLAMRWAKREDIDPDHVLNVSVWSIISSIIGARVVYVIKYWNAYKSNPVTILHLWDGGLIFFGGFITALVVILLYLRRYKIPYWKFLDLIAPSVAIGTAIGRIGCFLNGCCYGYETPLLWGVRFPNIYGYRHAAQLYYTVAFLIVFVYLLRVRKRQTFEGEVATNFFIYYSLAFFIVEIFRDNPRNFLYLTGSQVVSLIVMVFGVYAYRRRRAGLPILPALKGTGSSNKIQKAKR